VRELPGTGSKTGRLNTPDITKVAGSGAASQPFADKSHAFRAEARYVHGPGDASLVRDLSIF
ncbi:hypothetical protein, partial [Pseudomonas syringae group genomosp. 3]|uniref:hypothetical protein n=1 Tax=Pseudomonas syringae group genomosp. 3 TaxID=251701 RepID=UPI001C7F89CA